MYKIITDDNNRVTFIQETEHSGINIVDEYPENYNDYIFVDGSFKYFPQLEPKAFRIESINRRSDYVLAELKVVGTVIDPLVINPFASGEVGAIIRSSFDNHWLDLDIYVTFEVDGLVLTYKVNDIENIVIPKEILSKAYKHLLIGFCGYSNDDPIKVITTKITDLGVIPRGASCGESPEDPRNDTFKELVESIGDIDALKTNDKTNLVSAINELFEIVKKEPTIYWKE